MRLAEFKMRLLVFFAGALRKWAGSIEPTPDAPARRESPVGAVGDREAVSAERRREAGGASGPPEHWTRLVTTGPPDHWLDLIREKAPHLLPANENESVSTAEEIRDGAFGGFLQTQVEPESDTLPSSETETEARSASKRRSERPARGSTSRISGAKWLSRLRFQPPKQRPATEHAEHARHPGQIERSRYPNTEAPDYGAASFDGGPVAAGHDSSLTLPRGRDQRKQRRESISEQLSDRSEASAEGSRHASHSGNEVSEARDRPGHFESGHVDAGDAAGKSRRYQDVASAQESWREYSDTRSDRQTYQQSDRQTLPDARPEPASREAGNNPRQPRDAKIFANIFVERGEANSARGRARSTSNSSDEAARGGDEKRAARSGESAEQLAGLRGLEFAKPGARFSSRASRHLGAAIKPDAAINAGRHPSETTPETALGHESHRADSRRVAAETRRATETAIAADARVSRQSQTAPSMKSTIQVATRDAEQAQRFAAVDLGSPALIESGKSMWPTLPPSQNFGITDALASIEHEADALRRLDREQRGNQMR